MPAGITATDGMMYTGATPWHKLGVKLDGEATAAEAIEAAQMDWQVRTQPVYVRNIRGGFEEIDGRAAILRQDTEEVFGVMGSGYQPVQNSEAFGFFDAVIGQGEAVYHTAGSLYGGKRVWILAKLPEDIEVTPGDVIQPYILLSNSHDGSQALRMQITPIRVVCWNTLSAALQRQGGFYAKHTRNVMERANEAREVLGLAHAYYQMFAKQVDQLVNTRMTVIEVQDYLQKVYRFKADQTYADQDHRILKSYETTLDLLSHPTNTIGGISGTKWAAYNAVSYYVDHERPVRGGAYSDDRRLDASWFGTGAELRQRAYDLLTV
jgi:phage/plasmid-like protein (TIGR03299 family)